MINHQWYVCQNFLGPCSPIHTAHLTRPYLTCLQHALRKSVWPARLIELDDIELGNVCRNHSLHSSTMPLKTAGLTGILYLPFWGLTKDKGLAYARGHLRSIPNQHAWMAKRVVCVFQPLYCHLMKKMQRNYVFLLIMKHNSRYAFTLLGHALLYTKGVFA